MKQLFPIASLIFFLSGCSSESISSLQNSEFVNIFGNQYSCFNSASSRNITDNHLSEGSIISFYSTNGIIADNVQLTQVNNMWKPSSNLEWSTDISDANITAYYPAIEDTASLYNSDGKLKDLIYCKKSVKYKSPVVLHFQHLFTQLEFQVTPSLNNQLSEIEFTPAISIETINYTNANIGYTTSVTHTVRFTREENGIYTLIVPPAENQSVQIQLTTPDGIHKAILSSSDFQSGHHYSYHLRQTEEGGGISTAEDFIAFSYLISGKEYPGRNLEEFQTIDEGKTIYRLLNDIYFTPEECSRIQPIGHYKDGKGNGFKDCFDGQNYTLYGLQLTPAFDADAYGLFSYIDTTGIVKDLNLQDVSYSNTTYTCYCEGILAGRNHGTITGCHIKGSNKIAGGQITQAGGIVGINNGHILNSSSENILFDTENAKAGGIVYNNRGKVRNCYMANCNFNTTVSAGGICWCVLEKNGEMSNCYTFQGTGNSKKYGSLVYLVQKSSVKYGYSNNSKVKLVYSKDRSTVEETYLYNATTMETENGIAVIDLLNTWVQENNTNSIQSTFYNWIEGENPPLILQHP